MIQGLFGPDEPLVSLMVFDGNGELISETIYSDPISAEVDRELMLQIQENTPETLLAKIGGTRQFFVEYFTPPDGPLAIQAMFQYDK